MREIKDEQTAFIRNRKLKNNVRKVLNMIEWAHKRMSIPPFFLDAENVFDSIEWQFLKQILLKMGFGPCFAKGVAMLYQ